MYLVLVMSSLTKQRQRIGKHVHHTRFAGKRFAYQHKPVKKSERGCGKLVKASIEAYLLTISPLNATYLVKNRITHGEQSSFRRFE